MRLKKSCLLLLIVAWVRPDLPAQAPILYNAGTKIAVTGGAVLYADGAVDNASGLFSNAGHATIKGDFTNSAIVTGGEAASGVYYVNGDWINNSTFNADQSEVVLNGATQNIGGSQQTTFYNLKLSSSGSVKTQAIDVSVANIDSLGDCEQATGDFNLNILSTEAAAVERTTGFVSSTRTGRLKRAAASTDTYLFPTGWNNNGNIIYRPVEFTPSTIDAQTFAVRFAYENATGDGFDTSKKASNVSLVNGQYYHLLSQKGVATPCSLTIYFDPGTDGQWASMGQWQDLPEWTDLAHTNAVTSSPLYSIAKTGWMDNGNEPHALIKAIQVNTLWSFPNVFDPASTDPLNSTFHIINFGNYVTVLAMRIFDRWGEVVYDSQRDGVMRSYYGANTFAWDGTYEGKNQSMGNYIYTVSIKINETGETKSVSGNVALIR